MDFQETEKTNKETNMKTEHKIQHQKNDDDYDERVVTYNEDDEWRQRRRR